MSLRRLPHAARPWDWLLALLTGIVLGLLYAWAISPVRYVDISPATLRDDFKDDYRAAIAAAYAASGDLNRARARLTLLGDPDPVQALSAQAQRMLANGEPFGTVRQVALLATDLQQAESNQVATPQAGETPPASTLAAIAPTAEASTATPEPTEPPAPIVTATPRPTHTPTPTPGQPYALVAQEQVCDPNLAEGLLQITILNSGGRQVPGAELVISWQASEEHFFTGLKPELGHGYADYRMTPGLTYTLRVAGGSVPVGGLSAPSCQSADGTSFYGGLKLTFQQP